MSELPEGWTTLELRECVDVLDNARVPVNSEERNKRQGTVPYYGATGQVGWIDDYLFDEELLLIGEDGAPFFDKSKPIAYIINGRSWVNNHAHVLRAKGGTTTNAYLKHLLDQFDFHAYVNGTTRLKLTQGALNRIPVKLAPCKEQLRIVATLEELLGKVTACQNRLARIPVLLKRFRQSVLAAACSGRLTADWRETQNHSQSVSRLLESLRVRRKQVWQSNQRDEPKRSYLEAVSFDPNDLPAIPHTWEWTSADALCSQITDGEHIQPRYHSQGRPMLTAKHVRDGYVTFDNAGYIKKTDFTKCLKRCAPANGDILIVSVGATTGRSAIVEDCPPFAIVRSVLLLKPLVDSLYLLRWIQSPWCFTWMTQASGASAQPHLYIKDTKRMPVPIAPLAEQQEIIRRVKELFEFADQIEARYNKAQTQVDKLTQSVLAKAFRGELVPTEAKLARRGNLALELKGARGDAVAD